MLLFIGCYNPFERTRQIHSFETVKLVCQRLEELRAKHGGVIPEQDFIAALHSIRSGQDEWGQPLLFSTRATPHFSYVVVSTGSDRSLDVTSTSEYCSMPKIDIRCCTARDIVFRDGEAVTNAGKEAHTEYPPLK